MSKLLQFFNINKQEMAVPIVKLNNGLTMPSLGLGTWQSNPGEVAQAVKDAIDIGYRHIDCAHLYGNEKEIGEALTAKFKEGVVKRKDMFITSKLWNNAHRPDLVEKSCRTTLEHLGLDYLDLYLIHWPMGFKEEGDLFPMVNNEMQLSEVDYVDTWKAMEALLGLGLTKSIGISNFNKEQIQRILAAAKIKPVTNQVECHPCLAQIKLGALMAKHGIVLTAYSPLGSPQRPNSTPDEPNPLTEPNVLTLSKKYNKTPAQVLIRYQMDKGNSVIPKSVNKERIRQNFDVLNFKLTNEEVKLLNGCDKNGRLVFMSNVVHHKYYPFNCEY